MQLTLTQNSTTKIPRAARLMATVVSSEPLSVSHPMRNDTPMMVMVMRLWKKKSVSRAYWSEGVGAKSTGMRDGVFTVQPYPYPYIDRAHGPDRYTLHDGVVTKI